MSSFFPRELLRHRIFSIWNQATAVAEEKVVSCGEVEIYSVRARTWLLLWRQREACGRMQERLWEDKPATKLSARASRNYILPITWMRQKRGIFSRALERTHLECSICTLALTLRDSSRAGLDPDVILMKLGDKTRCPLTPLKLWQLGEAIVAACWWQLRPACVKR